MYACFITFIIHIIWSLKLYLTLTNLDLIKRPYIILPYIIFAFSFLILTKFLFIFIHFRYSKIGMRVYFTSITKLYLLQSFSIYYFFHSTYFFSTLLIIQIHVIYAWVYKRMYFDMIQYKTFIKIYGYKSKFK